MARYLPPEMIIDIISRLPIRTIINCKCVCKSWFNLVETHEFVQSHHARSVPRLAAFNFSHQLFRVEDGLNLTFDSCCKDYLRIGGSVNGLLFVRDLTNKRACVLNPITRDGINFDNFYAYRVTYCGFGTSKITGKYKLVTIFHNDEGTFTSYCYVYTLGTGLWRHIKPDSWVYYSHNDEGTFLNGNLHWLVRDYEGTHWISCFDLENELFTTFSPPPLLSRRGYAQRRVHALEDCLCLSDTTPYDDKIVIWLMEEYGMEKSWTKKFVIGKNFENLRRQNLQYDHINPIRVSKDGDVLMLLIERYIFSYSKKNNNVERYDFFGWDCVVDPILYTPNFLSLRRFKNEYVYSLHPEYMYHVYRHF
ncbi:hypothetical protein ACS0TY_018905 [Phlomoides rotata]